MYDSTLTLDSVPKIRQNVTGRLIDDEAVVVLPERGKVEVLNQVGAFIWERADGTNTVRDIIQQVCTEFEVQSEEAEQDTLIFLSDLRDRGVIQVLDK